MILHPALIALLLSTALISLMVVYASYYGLRILRKWDLHSGSELQLNLERRTYLISTVLAYAFAFEIVALLLFVYTADSLCPLFVGAMCAAGTLNVNGFGYPDLLLKVVIFVLAGLWLILNHTDNKAPDYPLIKVKYLLLLVIAPLVLADLVAFGGYMLNLKANVITSCCGTLFSQAPERALGQDVSFLSSVSAKDVFYPSIAFTLCLGAYFYFRGKGGYLLAAFSAVALPVSIASIISYVSPYFYELPTHHCPFCILQKDYYYVGYFLYATLFGGSLAGMGVGMLMPFRNVKSLREVVPPIQRRLALASAVLFLVFIAIVVYRVLATDFILET
jgi:hypothetical protein